ncbi:hypothetical protein Ancab_019982 [Ancistrocladus abbreviatus]
MARLHAFRGPTAEAMEASAASLTLWTLLLISLEEEREVGLLLVIFFRALRNLKANLVLSDLEFKEDEEVGWFVKDCDKNPAKSRKQKLLGIKEILFLTQGVLLSERQKGNSAADKF